MKSKTTLVLLSLTLILSSGAAGLLGADQTAMPAGPNPSDDEEEKDLVIQIHDENITSFDGTTIVVTVFRPMLEDPVPVVLHSHGWSGSRTQEATGLVGDLAAAGYGVISVDARGHGESGGEANVHHRDVEVKDFQAVLDHAQTLDWVLEDEDDIVTGAVGGSYGGGYQLMTASFDDRLDAIVPQMTWNHLPYSLAPNGAIKTVWVSGLYGLAKASGTRILPEIDQWFLEAAATNEFPEAARTHFEGASPEPQDIRAHVLLQQSFMDTLFNMNEGLENHRVLKEHAGAEGYNVTLFTYLGGHVSPTGGFPWQAPDSINTSPCGDMDEITVAWFDRHLKGLETDLPAPVSYALETGDCLQREETAPDEVHEVSAAQQVAAPQGQGSLVLPLLVVEEETHIVGIPELTFTATGLGDTILHASLAVAAGPSGPHVIDHQIAGLRFQASLDGDPQAFDLNAVATKLLPGDVLTLRLDAANEQYAANGNRVPGGVLLEDVTLRLPLLHE